LLAAGSGAKLGAGAVQGRQTTRPETSLTAKDHFDVGDRGPQMTKRASELGAEYLPKYGNCAQATIAALQDALEFIPKSDDVYRAGSCLHGGATATGNANCGGFTGAGMVIGHLCGRTRAQGPDREAMKLAMALIQQIAVKHEEAYGSVICKDIRTKAEKKCAEVVARAAGWAAEAILKQFS
jgi:C_GCAxxG_C_C family probable redox protein